MSMTVCVCRITHVYGSGRMRVGMCVSVRGVVGMRDGKCTNEMHVAAECVGESFLFPW